MGLKLSAFWICAAIIVLAGIALTIFDVVAINKFIFFAGYVVLQYVVLATAWNIMGGYMGYVNFGTAGFLRGGRVRLRRPLQPDRSAAGTDDFPSRAWSVACSGLPWDT